MLIEQDEDGFFVVEVPALPGCVSQGETREDALANIREAIAGYLESLTERQEPIPPSIHEEIAEAWVADLPARRTRPYRRHEVGASLFLRPYAQISSMPASPRTGYRQGCHSPDLRQAGR